MKKSRKKSAKVYVMPGVERRDLAGAVIPSEEVLTAALAKGITDVTVIGLDREGGLYIASSLPDVDRMVGILMRAITVCAGFSVKNPTVIDTE